jgi:ABC-2 type transport system permease protein
MLVHLVKKDFLLIKKYMALTLIGLFALPAFIQLKLPVTDGGFLTFFLSTVYIQFLLFNSVSMKEYKYKGSTLLCAAPYTRGAMVQAKYLFMLVIFVGSLAANLIIELAVSGASGLLDVQQIAVVYLFATVLFSVLIPLQYRFGYEKSKLMFMLVIFLLPFVLPALIQWAQENGLSLDAAFPVSQMTLSLAVFGLALAAGWLSMRLSVRIYSRQSL